MRRTAFICWLCLCALWSPLVRAQHAGLAAAVERYQRGEFAASRDLLRSLLDDPGVPPAGRAQVRIYLAASLLALQEPHGAREQLAALAREHPEVRLDPALFVPELVALAEQTRAEELRRQQAVRDGARADEGLTPPPIGDEPPPARASAPWRAPRVIFGLSGLYDVRGPALAPIASVQGGLGGFDFGVRAVIGRAPAFGVEGSFNFLPSGVTPRLGVRYAVVPSEAAHGGGLTAGLRVPLTRALVGTLELGAERFFAPARFDPWVASVSAGLGWRVGR